MQPEYMRMFLAEVEEELKNRKMSKLKFMDMAGLVNSVVYSAFNNKSIPTPQTLDKMAKALDMKIIMCLGDSDE